MGLSMLLQAVTAEKNQRTSLLVMALVFSAVTATMASGLALYFFMNALLSVGQTAFVKKIKSWRGSV